MRRRKMKLLAGVKTNTLLVGLAGVTVLYFLMRRKDLNGFGVPGGGRPTAMGECLTEWWALQRKMKGRMGERGGRQVGPGLAVLRMHTGAWLSRCIARKTPIGYGIPTIMPFYGGAYGKKLSSEAHCAAALTAQDQGKGQYKYRNVERQISRFCTEAKREKQEYEALYGTGEEDDFQAQTEDLMRQLQESGNGTTPNGSGDGGMGLMWPLVGLGVLGSLGVVGIILVGGKKKKKKKKRKKR